MEGFGWHKEAFFQELDTEEARELLKIFEISARKLLAEIEEALTQGELSRAREKAHALKGACATIFFEKARILAYDLERAPDLETARRSLELLRELLRKFLEEVVNF
jgi:HPt (histidine-containing phosphotransfer) domain-containing protein